MQSSCCETLTVPTYAVGPDGLLRPSALLRMQQEAGEKQMAGGGIGAGELLKRGLAFVVTRLCVEVTRLPRMGEPCVLTTWHRETRGVQFFRCYTLTEPDGTPLTAGVSAFALVDTEKHHLLRPDALGEGTLPAEPEHKNGCPDPKKELPPSLTEVAALRPRWSELDQNGHVNNTCYADFLCDFVPSGMARKRVTGFSVRFERETLPADILTLSAAENRWQEDGKTGGVAWVAGHHARGEAFVGRLCYEDDYERRF